MEMNFRAGVGIMCLTLQLSFFLSCFCQSTLDVKRTMGAAPTCACCPRGSLSIHVLALLACSCRTTERRARQVRWSAGTGRGPGLGGVVAVRWALVLAVGGAWSGGSGCEGERWHRKGARPGGGGCHCLGCPQVNMVASLKVCLLY